VTASVAEAGGAQRAVRLERQHVHFGQLDALAFVVQHRDLYRLAQGG
jgi:hypothetical protein